MGNTKLKVVQKSQKSPYEKFAQINGEHPLKKAVPESVVEYQARTRHGGKVSFFNFHLGKQLGLIPEDHPETLTEELKERILYTFGIVIINEYDVMNNVKIPKEDIRPHTYMATRYLQLQHPCKKGTTSGDGRSIWNGQVSHKGKTWDISSCGTGATKLSPASNINKKFYQTGDPTVSYGCGYSEVDEGLSSLFFSEVMKKNGTETEQVLAIIEYSNKISINVRAHENLIRPSHMFNHLKQTNLESLRKMVNFYIERQIQNKEWKDVPAQGKARWDYFAKKQAEVFAKISANFEDEYIFCWLDWDGDNILMDGGIIDYGSVRQFGLYHHEYRYDDVNRYSTSIKEQKQKAKYTVQTFAQIADFLTTGKKKNVEDYKNHWSLQHFEKVFAEWKLRNIVRKVGFNPAHVEWLIQNCRKDIEEFRKDFSYFEMAKSVRGPVKVPDGINWNAIFCMRDILRELPQIYLSRGLEVKVSEDEFLEIIRSKYATKADLKRTIRRDLKIRSFQKNYLKLTHLISKKFKMPADKVMLELTMRSSIINKYDRITGDSITTIVHKILNRKPRFNAEETYALLKEFTSYQNLNPDREMPTVFNEKEKSSFVKGVLQIVRDFRDGL